jgi:hypothetical protein
MDLDTYIQQIESIAYQVAVNSDGNKVRTWMEPYYLDENTLDKFFKMIEIKKQIITSDEQWQSEIFSIKRIETLNIDIETKILLTAIYLEVLEKVQEIWFLQSLEKYREDHPIFINNSLYKYVYDNKLINFNILKWDKSGCFCEYNGRFYMPNSFLKEELLQFTREQFIFKKKFIRLDAYYCSEKRPPMYLKEEVLRPVNPKWIDRLNLFKGQSTGGHYILQEPEFIPGITFSKEQQLKRWEYNFKGIRSLETHAQRNNSGNLRMIIEEIADKPICKGHYVAKCIHLDSDNIVGTQFKNAILNHIDLAINVYSTEAFNERKSQSLAYGRVVNASLRTHLLRFEGVPFRTLINLSTLFFSSQALTMEWISDQFK